MSQTANFFYDGQIRRFITQFIRLVSNFHVEIGKQTDGTSALQRVPVFYGDASRQAAQIIRGNSENALPSVPAMAVYINALDYDRERIQEPYHVSKLNIRERQYNEDTGEYGSTQGDSYTVERLMPVPYKISLKLDVWTSSTEQKLQLFEQIATLFNPSLEIQSTDNYIDWTSLSAVYLEGTSWDSRSVPAGGDESISIMTMNFSLPVWISSPAKVKKLGVIQKVVNSLFDPDGALNFDEFSGDWLSSRVITLLNYGVVYSGNSLRLTEPSDTGVEELQINTRKTWRSLIDAYGSLRSGTSQVRLTMTNSSHEIIGTVAFHPADDTQLLFTPFVDTLPTNTLTPVNAIIDPYNVNVTDMNILEPESGTRFLILNPIGSYDNNEAAVAWGGTSGASFVANAGDVIEYNGSNWIVSFDSHQESSVQYVTNLNTNTQYEYSNRTWTKSVEGIYSEGEWRIVL